MDTVSFLEIILKQLIEEARDLQRKTPDALINGQLRGYCFAIKRILGHAAGNDLFDYLPDNLKNFDPESLLRVPPKIPKQ